jgi:hypothetical protein
MPRKVLVFMVLGVFFGMMAGVAVAGELERDPSGQALLQQSADPESSLGWQVSGPMETGAVPSMEQEEYQGQAQPAESFNVEEIGSTMYRVGIDFGP